MNIPPYVVSEVPGNDSIFGPDIIPYVCERAYHGRPKLLPDNVVGICAACGHLLQHRRIDLGDVEREQGKPVKLVCRECVEDHHQIDARSFIMGLLLRRSP